MSDVACRVCGSGHVVPDAEVRDYDATSYRTAAIYADRGDPQATMLLGIIPATIVSTIGTLRARVCGDCGHVELFSPEAARMWAEYSAGPGEPPPPPAAPPAPPVQPAS